jgi:phosphopantothenoylcysteine decarboxylase/phosphopantothenate--cysteine ligase
MLPLASKSESKHIVVCVTGSIAAYKAPVLVSGLKKDGCEVECVATEHALDFVGRAALEGVSRRPLHDSMFTDPHTIAHISLAEWADLIIVYPATASTIARLRTGSGDDLLSALFLANNFRVPYWIAPAMNTHMFSHPAVQENLKILETWGCRILPTEEGILACGTSGNGKLLDPEAVRKLIHEL